jgi:hypothetical protein
MCPADAGGWAVQGHRVAVLTGINQAALDTTIGVADGSGIRRNMLIRWE